MIILAVLINVALLTLLERKILGLRQIRVGPNKVGRWGALQPAADAVKLFLKRVSVLGPINKFIFFASPLVRIVLALLFLPLITTCERGASVVVGALLLFTLLSLNVYPLLGAGWASNRKYAILGRLRAVSQTIAYEISLGFVTVAVFLM